MPAFFLFCAILSLIFFSIGDSSSFDFSDFIELLIEVFSALIV